MGVGADIGEGLDGVEADVEIFILQEFDQRGNGGLGLGA